jgi:hypothetical protein
MAEFVKREAIGLLLFVWFISFVWLNQTNQINQMNQTDHKRREPDAVGGWWS